MNINDMIKTQSRYYDVCNKINRNNKASEESYNFYKPLFKNELKVNNDISFNYYNYSFLRNKSSFEYNNKIEDFYKIKSNGLNNTKNKKFNNMYKSVDIAVNYANGKDVSENDINFLKNENSKLYKESLKIRESKKDEIEDVPKEEEEDSFEDSLNEFYYKEDTAIKGIINRFLNVNKGDLFDLAI